MGEPTPAPRLALLSRSWDRDNESAFVLRAVAGALSRRASVDVYVPGPAGVARADGAFSVIGLGGVDAEAWPDPSGTRWPEPAVGAAVTDVTDQEASKLLAARSPGLPIAVLVPDATPVPPGTALALSTGPSSAAGTARGPVAVGLHVPINPMAKEGRHNGLGFTDYLVVLTDRRGRATAPAPTALAAWLAARYPKEHVVVIEDAVASVYWDRSLRGRISVDTRTDLWRLLAHARVTIDLAPGGWIARECVESLRYGVPVIVPADTAAAELAAGGGGLWYRDVAELFACVGALGDPDLRRTLGAAGQTMADAAYGDPAGFVSRLGQAFEAAGLFG